MSYNNKQFSQSAFKEEVQQKACEMQDSTSYQWEAHKSVANDAAVMAASKAPDFAKVAAAGFPAPRDEPEGYIEMAKEKLGDSLETAKDTLSSAFDSAKERTGHAYETTMGTLSGALEGAKEKTGEAIGFVTEKIKGSSEMSSQNMSCESDSCDKQFAQSAFKCELQQKACEMQGSTSYQWEAHKSVANDAAVMAASKAPDFAKVAAAGFPAPRDEPEGYIEIAKEKIGETFESAKDTLSSALDSAKDTLSGAFEGAKEKTGEAIEFVAEKMKGAGEALSDKAEDAKAQGLKMQHQNMRPSNAI